MEQKTIDGKKQTGNIFLEVAILLISIGFICGVGVWQTTSSQWKITLGGNLFPQAFIKADGYYWITYLNQESLYLSFLSVLFSFLGNREDVVSIINLILQIAGVLCFYFGTRKLFRFISPLFITIISGVLSICFYPVIWDTSMHFIWFLTGLLFWLGSETYGDKPHDGIKRIFLGFLLGIFCYIDLAGFFLLALFLLLVFLKGELSVKDKKIPIIYFLNFLLGSIYGFFIMFYLWNNFLFNLDVLQYWFQDKMQYFYSESGMFSYICIGSILGVILILYMFKGLRKTGTTEIIKQDIENEAESVSAVEPPLELPDREIVSKEITTEEPVKKIKFIENPLPLPKKHVKKEMKYAFEPTPDQMHYDLNNYRIDDDYDLKDN